MVIRLNTFDVLMHLVHLLFLYPVSFNSLRSFLQIQHMKIKEKFEKMIFCSFKSNIALLYKQELYICYKKKCLRLNKLYKSSRAVCFDEKLQSVLTRITNPKGKNALPLWSKQLLTVDMPVLHTEGFKHRSLNTIWCSITAAS